MISEKIEGQDADDMLVGVFEILNLLYQQCQEADPEKKMNRNIRPNEMYMVANPQSKLWEIITSKEMSERYQNL
ncbi:MAG: hypothetical protein EOO88_25300 [Pedobacter sp.]|nr:MAG: hypothetical protein EOO88_25300 [Pedobacter sp.]